MALVRMATECVCITGWNEKRLSIWHWFEWQQSVYVALVRMATECVCGTVSDGNRVSMWHWFGCLFVFPASDHSHLMVLCVFRVYIIIYMTVDGCCGVCVLSSSR